MPARAYRDPTLDAVIHREGCRSVRCPRCTEAPAAARNARREEAVHAGMIRLAAIVRQRRILTETSSNEEDPVREHGVSATHSEKSER